MASTALSPSSSALPDTPPAHWGAVLALSLGGFALLTSLLVAPLTTGWNRKTLLIGLTGLMVVSGTVVALAPNAAVFMAGRALIGVAIGGFWSMSAATAMLLVLWGLVGAAAAVLILASLLAAQAGRAPAPSPRSLH